MTREELEKTEWAKGLEKNAERSKNQYAWIGYMVKMVIAGTIDLPVTVARVGRRSWEISTGDVVMARKRSEKAALALCREMGWKVKR